MTTRTIERRNFLQAVGGTVALAAATGTTLGACSGSESQRPNTAERNSAVTLPTYIPFQGSQPTYPSTSDGVMAGFDAYPATPKAVTSGVPASGGVVTALTLPDGTPPPPLDKNVFWQELNKRLGTELKFNLALANQYQDKVSTVLAGGDLPDIMQISPTLIHHLPQVLESKFADLSDFLSGDAVNDYPFLANLPTVSWKSTVYNGGIYAIPLHRGVVGNIMLTREDLLEKRGLNSDVSSGEEFLELCRALADPKRNTWALGDARTAVEFVQEMVGAPNVWAEKDGKFTHSYESEQTKRALDIVAGMWKEQLFHPDAFTSGAAINDWLMSGKIFLRFSNYGGWMGLLRDYRAQVPDLKVGGIIPPGYDGGAPRKFITKAIATITAFKKANKGRIEELLRIANWIAAPFGTEEHRFRYFGIEGRSYTLNGSDPVLTPTGIQERRVPTSAISGPPHTLYQPGEGESIARMHEYQKKTVPTGVRNAADNLFSDSDSTIGATLNKTMADLQAEIIQGRKSIADWDNAVAQWKSQGGDKIRAEYEADFEKTATN